MKNHAHRIADSCLGPAQQVRIKIVEETGSTNADLLAAVASLQSPELLIAERQTAGRGRAGRTWLSAPGASLTFSLAWKFALPLHSMVGLPLAVGVALAEALAELGVKVRLKWPNDVLYDDGKLAGILIETAGVDNDTQSCWAVIGIGINLMLDPEMAAQIGRPVAHVPQLTGCDRDELMATLLNALARAAVLFGQEGFGAFAERWNSLHAYTAQPVSILDQGRVLHEGVAVGVDRSGRFLLDTSAGRTAVMAGDVSLRAKEA